MKKVLTIKDIAEIAGVSVGTVSRVLNQVENVDPFLRERTLAVIRETRFTPLRKHRRKKERENCRVALLFQGYEEDWRNTPMVSGYLSGVERIRSKHPVEFSCYFGRSAETILEQEGMNFDGLLVKGALMSYTGTLERLNTLAANLPVVGFGMSSPLCLFPQVSLDNYSAGILAVEELIRRGHRAIAFINTNLRHQMFLDRSRGYSDAMKRHGLWEPGLLKEPLVSTVREDSPEAVPPSLKSTVGELLEQYPETSAVIVSNDWGCIGVYRACEALGIPIPERLSVIGFDNCISICCALNPTLSTIDNPLAAISEIAANHLLGEINSRGLPPVASSTILAQGRFISRNSIQERSLI